MTPPERRRPEQETPAPSRRAFLKSSGFSLGAIALDLLLTEQSAAAGRRDPLAARPPHFAPRAKNIIYLHMIGAPSQLDLFDPKPKLQAFDGKPCPEELIAGKNFAFIGGEMTLAGSPFRFAQHGQSGQVISELLPHLSTVADELCFIHSVHTEEINHGPAQTFLHSGFGRNGRPSIGAWVTYGLGSENANLPAFVVLRSGPKAGAGSSLWSSGFLPSVYQGVQFRSSGDPVLYLSNPAGHSTADRRQVLNAIGELNEHRFQIVGDPEIATRIKQYEMAFRMQESVPDLMDVSSESEATLQMYGATPGKPSFAANCLQARRLVERGVRMVELYDADWDHHRSLETRLPAKCRDIDQGIAALIRDLKQRGLLDETLIVWGSEFGRTPLRQTAAATGKKTKPGRDHHKDAYTIWLAGGGIKGGLSYGKTDELGFETVENPVHVHDLNATVLHMLGLDHEDLTYKYQGREFRLTDVHGRVLNDLLS